MSKTYHINDCKIVKNTTHQRDQYWELEFPDRRRLRTIYDHEQTAFQDAKKYLELLEGGSAEAEAVLLSVQVRAFRDQQKDTERELGRVREDRDRFSDDVSSQAIKIGNLQRLNLDQDTRISALEKMLTDQATMVHHKNAELQDARREVSKSRHRSQDLEIDVALIGNKLDSARITNRARQTRINEKTAEIDKLTNEKARQFAQIKLLRQKLDEQTKDLATRPSADAHNTLRDIAKRQEQIIARQTDLISERAKEIGEHDTTHDDLRHLAAERQATIKQRDGRIKALEKELTDERTDHRHTKELYNVRIIPEFIYRAEELIEIVLNQNIIRFAPMAAALEKSIADIKDVIAKNREELEDQDDTPAD